MHKNLLRLLQVIVAVVCIATAMAVPTQAAGPGFSAKPVIPENQRGGAAGYFDLRMTPGQKQDLTVVIANEEDTEIQVEVEAISASTAPNGFVDYATAGVEDESLHYPFSKIASVREKVLTIPPKGKQEAVISVTMPDQEFDGVILGGYRVKKLIGDTAGSGEGEQEEATAGITNVFQYVVAVVLTNNDNPVDPDFELINVTPELIGGRAVIIASVRNNTPGMFGKIAMTADLYREGVDEPVFQMERPNVSVAPNSVWGVRFIDMEGDGLAAGNYNLKMTLTREGKAWDFEHPFIIEQSEAESINREATNQQSGNSFAGESGGLPLPIWAIVLIAVGAILLLLLIIKLIKTARDNNAYEQEMMDKINKLNK